MSGSDRSGPKGLELRVSGWEAVLVDSSGWGVGGSSLVDIAPSWRPSRNKGSLAGEYAR